jgi:hypothetical protein
VYLGALLFVGYYDVVNVCGDISVNLISKYGLGHSVKCWADSLEAFGLP